MSLSDPGLEAIHTNDTGYHGQERILIRSLYSKIRLETSKIILKWFIPLSEVIKGSDWEESWDEQKGSPREKGTG